jgi:hypothetical protein
MLDYNSAGQALDGKIYLNLGRPGRTPDDFVATFAHEALHHLTGASETRAFYVQNYLASTGQLELSEDMKTYVTARLDQARWQEEAVKLPSGVDRVSVASMYGENERLPRGRSHPTIPSWKGKSLPTGRVGGVLEHDDGRILRERLGGGSIQVGIKLPNGKSVYCNGRSQVLCSGGGAVKAAMASSQVNLNRAASYTLSAAAAYDGGMNALAGLAMAAEGDAMMRAGYQNGDFAQYGIGGVATLAGASVTAGGVSMAAGAFAPASTALGAVSSGAGAASVATGGGAALLAWGLAWGAVGYGVGTYTTGPAADYATTKVMNWYYGN